MISEPVINDIYTTVSEDCVYYTNIYMTCPSNLYYAGKRVVAAWCDDNLDRWHSSVSTTDGLTISVEDIDESLPNAIAFKLRWL